MATFSLPEYKQGDTLLKKANSHWDKYSEQELKGELQKARDARKSPYLYAFLQWKYGKGKSILRRGGETYPLVVYKAPETQWKDVETALLHLEVNCPPDDTYTLKPTSAHFRALVAKLSPKLFHGKSFTLQEIQTKGQLGLKCELGSYYRNLDTCLSLEWEILSEAHNLTDDTEAAFKKFEKRLPLRNAHHSQNAHPVVSGSARSAGIAISTLVVFGNPGNYRFILQKRTGQVAVDTLTFHVIPSFMFAPETFFLQTEFNVKHNIFREYLEECFNKPEAKRKESNPEYFYQDDRLVFLQNLMDTGFAQLYFSGVAVNLLNLRPEICTVLFIETDKWWERHKPEKATGETGAKTLKDPQKLKFNDEWEGYVEPIQWKVTDTDNDIMQSVENQKASLKASDTVPPAAAAVWLGIDLLRKVLAQRKQS